MQLNNKSSELLSSKLYIYFFCLDKSAATENKKTPEPEQHDAKPPDPPENLYTSSETDFSDEKNLRISGVENRGMSGILGKIMDNIVDKKKKVNLYLMCFSFV